MTWTIDFFKFPYCEATTNIYVYKVQNEGTETSKPSILISKRISYIYTIRLHNALKTRSINVGLLRLKCKKDIYLQSSYHEDHQQRLYDLDPTFAMIHERNCCLSIPME